LLRAGQLVNAPTAQSLPVARHATEKLQIEYL